jgi:hypothetical protein
MLQTRLELASVELAEERGRLMKVALLACFGLVFFSMALMTFTLLVAIVFWESLPLAGHRHHRGLPRLRRDLPAAGPQQGPNAPPLFEATLADSTKTGRCCADDHARRRFDQPGPAPRASRPVRFSREVRLPLEIRKELLITRAALERYDAVQALHNVKGGVRRMTSLGNWLPNLTHTRLAQTAGSDARISDGQHGDHAGVTAAAAHTDRPCRLEGLEAWSRGRRRLLGHQDLAVRAGRTGECWCIKSVHPTAPRGRRHRLPRSAGEISTGNSTPPQS